MADISANVFLISRGFRSLILKAYEPVRERTKLGQMELQIIYALFHQPRMTVGEIFKNTQFNKGQISTCVSKLVKRGYVVIVDRANTRFDAYILTDTGMEAAKEIDENAKKGRKRFLKGFTKEEAAQFQNFLERILGNIGEFDQAIKDSDKFFSE